MKIAALILTSALTLISCANRGQVVYPTPEEWVQSSKQGMRLPLAAGADTWSEPKRLDLPSGPVEVQAKFIKHFGSTCEFEVKFTNKSEGRIQERVTLVGGSPIELKLEPNHWSSQYMEKRGCGFSIGDSKDMKKCAACVPELSI